MHVIPSTTLHSTRLELSNSQHSSRRHPFPRGLGSQGMAPKFRLHLRNRTLSGCLGGCVEPCRRGKWDFDDSLETSTNCVGRKLGKLRRRSRSAHDNSSGSSKHHSEAWESTYLQPCGSSSWKPDTGKENLGSTNGTEAESSYMSFTPSLGGLRESIHASYSFAEEASPASPRPSGGSNRIRAGCDDASFSGRDCEAQEKTTLSHGGGVLSLSDSSRQDLILELAECVMQNSERAIESTKSTTCNPQDCRLLCRFVHKIKVLFEEVHRQLDEHRNAQDDHQAHIDERVNHTNGYHVIDVDASHRSNLSGMPGNMPDELAIGSVADAIDKCVELLAKCSGMGKLRSILWCERLSTQFQNVSRELMQGIGALSRGNLKVSDDVREDLEHIERQLEKAQFRPAKQERDLAGMIRFKVSTMRRREAPLDRIHASIREILLSIPSSWSPSVVRGRYEDELSFSDAVCQETRALQKDMDLLGASSEDNEAFLVRQVLAVIEANKHIPVSIRCDTEGPAKELNSEPHKQRNKKPHAKRPSRWHVPFLTAISLVFCLFLCLAWVYTSISKSLRDENWLRTLHLAFLPVAIFFMLFAFYTLFNSAMSGIGPIAHLEKNSLYYSSIPPSRIASQLPKVTIQMPVYKESLSFVIKPSLKSLMKATAKYRSLGGECNIYVNDDGLMLVSNEERASRIAFYEANGIAYCGRPPQSRRENGYKRRGRFKKASNMNFCLEVSLRAERLARERGAHIREALAMILTKGKTKFLVGGDVRIGEFILLVDSDTRVPEDCIAPTVTELIQSPKVAFTQHATWPMQVIHDYWENAISHFTIAVYSIAIRMACSGGDLSPLVGHNAFIRWKAMKECAFVDPIDKKKKFWSENHVSEDFDLSLRLQVAGYHGRYVTYTGQEFQEGVSLTVHDEIARFRKYSFGAAELLFKPLKHWHRGPISSLYVRYMCSKTVWWSKVTITSYMGSYFAISSAWWLALLHYFLFAWSEYWRNEVVAAVDIAFTVVCIFSVASPIGTAMLRYRLGMGSLGGSLLTEFKHVPVFMIFFNGLSFHLFVSVMSHLLQFNMEFGITSKEIRKTNFFKEVTHTIRIYKWCYGFMALQAAMMLGFYFAPPPWAIRSGYSIFPLSIVIFGHIFAPILLNPVLMRVKF